MDEKFKSIIQLMHVQKTILELELELGEGIPFEELETSVKKVEMLFEDKGTLDDVRCAMDYLEISKERFREIIRVLIDADEIKITDENDVVRVSWDEQLNSRFPRLDLRSTSEKFADKYGFSRNTHNAYKFIFKIEGNEIARGFKAKTDKEAIKMLVKEFGLVEFTCKVGDGREFNHKGGWNNH